MATKKSEAPSPYDIRKKTFTIAMDSAITEYREKMERWIFEGRTKPGSAFEFKVRVSTQGATNAEFAEDASKAVHALVKEYIEAGWRVELLDAEFKNDGHFAALIVMIDQ